VLRLVASDWQISPILKLRSAQFATVTLGTDVALNGEGSQRPNLVGGVDTRSSTTGCSPAPCIQWLNKAAFASPAIGSLGNLGIGNIKGPGVIQLDLALSRTFRVHETQSIQLRGEAFNLPNHLNPALPASALNSGTFGQITSDISGTSGLSAGDYRVIQFALKYGF